jgi:hypothetical protein
LWVNDFKDISLPIKIMPKLAQRLTDYEIKRLKPGDKKGLGRGLYIMQSK